MKCPNCGSENKDSAKFCKKCGSSLTRVVTHNNLIDKKETNNNNTKIVIVALIIVAIVLAGALVYIYGFGNNHSNDSTPSQSSNSQSVSNDNDQSAKSADSQQSSSASSKQDSKSMKIKGGSFSTGSELEDKTYASIYVGPEHAGESVTIQIFYSRDGNTLNHGNMVPNHVDSSGHIDVSSADSYKYYPDYATINLYDSSGHLLDSRSVSLSPTSGTQTF